VIDGWNGDSGDYMFLLEQLLPTPPGDDCSDPVVITSLPFSDNGVTSCNYSNDYTGSTCLSSQDEGPDVIYSFTLTTTTSVEIILTAYYADPPNESWVMPGVLLSDHCPPDWTCIGSATSWTINEYIPLVIPCTTLSPGTYWVMVDNGTWFHPCFTYDLLIQPCGPCDITSQGGDVPEVAENFRCQVLSRSTIRTAVATTMIRSCRSIKPLTQARQCSAAPLPTRIQSPEVHWWTTIGIVLLLQILSLSPAHIKASVPCSRLS
jgi:hypothetical protein